MGFLLRSTFWLGLVFHAMPLGEVRLADAVPSARDALAASLATQSRDGGVASAAASAVLRAALEPRPASAGKAVTPPDRLLKARRVSVDTLTASDRLVRWRGPGARAAL
ncbi:MAG: hypothetical protein ABSC22_18680 [Roseiarcus sp.]|jgi:hypothetical protein